MGLGSAFRVYGLGYRDGGFGLGVRGKVSG